jgi:catechol 1,2-dioxygenase
MDVWQANSKGHYDNEGETDANAPDAFINRVRLYSDRDGYYEFETVHPGSYQVNGPDGLFWRAPHIHIRVRCPEYETLVTELFFSGDPYHDSDLFLIPSTVIQLQVKKRNGKEYEEGVFNIVLPPQIVQTPTSDNP